MPATRPLASAPAGEIPARFGVTRAHVCAVIGCASEPQSVCLPGRLPSDFGWYRDGHRLSYRRVALPVLVIHGGEDPSRLTASAPSSKPYPMPAWR